MRRTFILLGIALTMLAVVFVGCVYWYGRIVAESTLVAGLEGQIEAQAQNTTRVASARAALSQIAGDESQVAAYFVSESNVVDFIDALEARGEALGVAVSVGSVSQSKIASHDALAVSLSLAGSFDAVMRTVGAIEYAPYDIVITSFDVNEESKDWHADLQILVGSAPAALPATSAASSATATSTVPTPAATSAPTTT